MAYGSADSVAELDAFYTHIRGGRRPSAAQLADLERRYLAIGGMSPLREITERQRAAVETELKRRGLDAPVFAAMKHVAPFIGDVVREMVDAGLGRIVGLVLAPHFSAMSVGSYRTQVEAAISGAPGAVASAIVESWHTEPRFVEAVSRAAAEALAVCGPDAHVVFTAHSLPERILAADDPYPVQLAATAVLVAETLGLATGGWSFAYQSAGDTGEPWLGPDLLEHLAALREAGVRDIVVSPIGFVADHLEILYDIDVEAQERAREQGLHLVRARSMNDDPMFVAAIADVLLRRAASIGSAS